MNIKSIFSTLLLMVSGAVFLASGQPQEKSAVVGMSAIYLRADADYESPLETQELMGTIVEIVASESYWKQVDCPQPYRAWCTDLGLVPMDETALEAYKKAEKVMFNDLYGHLKDKASDKAANICDLVGGDILRLVKKEGKWTRVMLPDGRQGYLKSKSIRQFDGFRKIAMGQGDEFSLLTPQTEQVLQRAMEVVGVPYLWGGMTPKGFDCSGLVRWSYLMNGVLLPRNASQQIKCGSAVEMEIDTSFWEEDKHSSESEEYVLEMQKRIKNLQRGDLLFFGKFREDGTAGVTHVGMYLGNGKMIHSSHLVRINSLIPGRPDSYSGSYRLLAARRL